MDYWQRKYEETENRRIYEQATLLLRIRRLEQLNSQRGSEVKQTSILYTKEPSKHFREWKAADDRGGTQQPGISRIRVEALDDDTDSDEVKNPPVNDETAPETPSPPPLVNQMSGSKATVNLPTDKVNLKELPVVQIVNKASYDLLYPMDTRVDSCASSSSWTPCTKHDVSSELDLNSTFWNKDYVIDLTEEEPRTEERSDDWKDNIGPDLHSGEESKRKKVAQDESSNDQRRLFALLAPITASVFNLCESNTSTPSHASNPEETATSGEAGTSAVAEHSRQSFMDLNVQAEIERIDEEQGPEEVYDSTSTNEPPNGSSRKRRRNGGFKQGKKQRKKRTGK